ncbi:MULTISPECIES: glycosyltransferase family protein [Olivibacter]|uniref:Glycosyltransferase involved in cell wall biosynthesis n=1 Tax=Olivibacter jilunii TaxID=985016 RepID=A0ABW6B784_9SPHI|nr:hypothetical protein [Olivibacter sp. UJ_SKK_5.1]MDX3912659.1 hypothetical protein [Pseudosphingobacterium sp.]
MRIVYVTEFNLEKPSGVLHKMNEQINAWSSFGAQVYVVSIPMTSVNSDEVLLTKRVEGYFIAKNSTAMRIRSTGIANFLNKIFTVSKVRKYIGEVNPDIIYFREMIAFPRLLSIFNNYKVVLESNTVLSTELEHSSLKLRQMYKWFQQKLYKRCNAFIGVTDEICRQFISYDKKSITIANSIFVTTDLSPLPNLNEDKEAQITFVGSPDCPWHGIDKFIEMARLMPQFQFNLVGPRHPALLPNLTQYGFLDKGRLIAVYKKTDVAIGTLALHRNKMEEACPLKVREYLSFGIPVILGYLDKDIEGQDFVLNLPNREHSVKENIAKIDHFIRCWKGKRVPLSLIEPLISTRVKEVERLNFLKSVATNDE